MIALFQGYYAIMFLIILKIVYYEKYMNYLTLQQLQKNTPVFSLASIRLQEPNFRVDQLMRWQKKGYIRTIIRGWYIFADQTVTEELLMLMANKLVSRSEERR